MKKIKVGLIGFGLSGKTFHMPLLLAHGGFQIEMVNSSRTAEVKACLPDTNITTDPYELISNPQIDLIINTAPNIFHYSYTEAALKNGKNVVVEKPFVNTSAEGKALIALAQSSGKSLAVFQNRRWDADFLTIKKIIAEGKLGNIKQFESHFDRWRPTYRSERWREQPLAGSGILYDLGAHLIDQALNLFGTPEELSADIAIQKEGSPIDDYFHLTLKYGTLRVILQASSFTNITPRFQIFGDQAIYTKYGIDPQEDQLRQGMSVLNSSFGLEDEKNFGQLVYPDQQISETIISERGSYLNYYDLLYNHLSTGKGELPVSALEALNVIELIELALQSSKLGKTQKLIF